MKDELCECGHASHDTHGCLESIGVGSCDCKQFRAADAPSVDAARKNAIERARDLYDDLFHRDDGEDEDNAFRTVLYYAHDAGRQAERERIRTAAR